MKMIIFAALVLLVGTPIMYYSSEEQIEVIVNDKERVSDGDKSSRYLVFAEGETFECTDEVLKGKFNSSDIYGMLKSGKRYQFKVIGFRVPFLSWYRNILSVYELDDEQPTEPAETVERYGMEKLKRYADSVHAYRREREE